MFVSLITLATAMSVHAFEVCTPQNGYLEKLLPKPETQITTTLDRECVAAAHRGFAAKGVYGFCPIARGRVKRDRVRPCDSEAYVSSVHAAIADVTECLGVDAERIFATLNLESGAHINAVGPAGDAGIGQLTRPAIDEVNRRAFAAARVHVQRSNLAACRKILPHMVPLTGDINNRCAFITVPDNPTRALIYSVLMTKQNQKTTEMFWNRLKPRVGSGINVTRLKQHLTLLAYNAGPAGPVAVTAAFAKRLAGKLSDRDLSFRNLEPGGLVQFIAKHFPARGVQIKWRKRIGHYVPSIIAALDRTEDRAGRSCGVEEIFPKLGSSFAPAETPNDLDDGADQEVEENMRNLADGFTPESRGFTCADAQAEFVAQFLPPDTDIADLPPYLRAKYDSLCGK